MNAPRLRFSTSRLVGLSSIASLGAAFFLGTLAHAATDPSTLVTKAEASVVLGQPVTRVMPIAEQTDDDTGGKLVACTFHGGQSALVVSVVTFSSANEAQAKMTKQQAAERLDGDDAQIVEEKGLGDRAYWATTEEGAEYIVVKGAQVLGLGLGGKLSNSPASYRQALRALVVRALAKL